MEAAAPVLLCSSLISRSSSRLRFPTRTLRLFSLPIPFLASRCSSTSSLPPVRCSAGPISAGSSSEPRKNHSSAVVSEDEKLRALREVFSRPGVGIDAYIIPSEDAHQSEFMAECFERRAFVSGFTGSAGTAIVTKDKASLWTDGRYFLQAENQLAPGWSLMRSGNAGVPTTTEWLNDVLAPGCRIGIDPFLFSSNAAEELRNAIAKKNHELVYLYDFNLVDEVWKESRPNPPCESIRLHPIEYAGRDVSSKLSSLRSELSEAGCTAIVISRLDEVAWLLNLRGSDVRNSPVFYAYLIVENNCAKLFVDNRKVTSEVMAYLEGFGVELRDYESILFEVKSLAANGALLWIDHASVNAAIHRAFDSVSDKNYQNLENRTNNRSDEEGYLQKLGKTDGSHAGGPAAMCSVSPITMAKAIKNNAELEGMRNSHLRDAAALAEFWVWLEEWVGKNVPITEVEIADKLLEFRSKQPGFMDTSFDTISAYGPNGAVIHYQPYPDSCNVVDDKNLFLLDSGAQYIDGTTDITRTVHFGKPTMWQKECFTRVLQGHIALDQSVFPENTPGFVLDVLARSPLWKIGLNYRHGTGHGVGAALNVHEGPQSISFRFGNMTPLKKGMIVSNEPGYYEDHVFGIRIENLLHVKEASTPNHFGEVEYLGFEKLTFIPIQTKLVDLSLLSADEVKWLNDYHSQVWEKVSPLLDGAALKWLWNNTRSLPMQ